MFERTVQASACARSLAWIAALGLGLAGCPHQELAPLGPCTVSATAQRVEQEGLSAVDLLFVIDNSGSMASKQIKLAQELPRLVQVLTTGDRDFGRDAPAGGARMFTPVSSLHLGVVSTNMGGLDEAPAMEAIVGISACVGLGDDGLFLNSADVAVEGVTAAMDFEFPNYAAGDVVLPPDPNCDGLPAQPAYQNYEAGKAPSVDEVALSFSCISKLGVRGCPLEQQLEAMWKALAPSSDDSFLDGTSGHGDPKGENAGFLRDESILAVMIVSDEDDCSVTQDGKALIEQTPEADQRYGTLNLRCGVHGGEQEGLVHPVQRYIDGLYSLKPNNHDRVIFSGIVGIPERGNGQSPQQVLNFPEMQFRAGLLGLPTATCTGVTQGRREDAYPGRRFLQVAQGFGSDAVIYSICSADYGPALDNLIEKIANKLSGNCLPRRLNPNAEGRVPCDVYELLPKGDDECTSDRGHVGDPITRSFQVGVNIEKRKACKMQQVPVANGTPVGGEAGWYYDDFSQGVMSSCPDGQQQRIVFSFGDLPQGASATFECFQSSLKADATARGFDAVNTSCRDNANVCRTRSNTDYTLTCIDGTCQAQCQINPDCPPGWVCASKNGGTSNGDAGIGRTAQQLYCQLPTCPASETMVEVGADDEE